MKHFYNNTKTAIIVILSMHASLSDYEDLTPGFVYKTALIPPLIYPQYDDAKNIYK